MHIQILQKTKYSIVGLLRGSISFVYSKGPEDTMASPLSPSYAFVAGSDPVTALVLLILLLLLVRMQVLAVRLQLHLLAPLQLPLQSAQFLH